jgi:hypothetical protein
MPEPKGLALIIGGGKGKSPADGEGMADEAEPDDPKMSAAQQAMDAFDSGDVAALNDALTAHYRACAAGEGDEEMPDEEMPEMMMGEEE